MSKKASNFRFILKTSIAAFGTYFCMYAFRKPFTVATFDHMSFWGIDYKILLILAQVLGYTLSKFMGIKIISELKSSKRILYLISFIAISELALLGFALVPAPYNILFLFINGLPLGMIWGIVFSYIEGRKTTELLGVILCSSFIVSSGAAKSVGVFVMEVLGCNEYWMPFVSGLLFIIPLILFSLFLEKVPNPDSEDLALRSKRKPLSKKERASLFQQFAFPLTAIIVFYAMLTAMREFRDNFARELWDTLGYKESIFDLYVFRNSYCDFSSRYFGIFRKHEKQLQGVQKLPFSIIYWFSSNRCNDFFVSKTCNVSTSVDDDLGIRHVYLLYSV